VKSSNVYRLKRSPIKRKPARIRKVTKLTLGKLKKSLLEIAKAYVRARDGKCMAAGADGRACWGYLQASHIFPEGIYHSMKFDPENMVGMCTQHHIYWWHKNPVEADRWLRSYLGQEKYDWLYKLRAAYKEVKWFEKDIAGLIELSKANDFAEIYKPYRPL
jgi:hypothetical protein